MKVSLNWIRDYVDLPEDLTAEKLAYELTMRTVEVESAVNPADLVRGIIVGKILSVSPHPDADKLRVCQVDCGTGDAAQIVCGGVNLYEGERVAVAPPGAEVIWHGEGAPVVIKASKLRGVMSAGMICSSTEINLGELFPLKEEAEILDLTGLFPDAAPGKPLAGLLELDDVILEIDNKSMTNRPDLWGHYGIARELAAIYGRALRPLPAFTPPENARDYRIDIEDPKRCRRYDAALYEGVSAVVSPFWMRRVLWSVDIRPINLPVDITNYVMLATGQPLHGFDQSHVENGIRVRTAREGETLELLDKTALKLHESDLLICDGTGKPIGLAGIMGGADDSVLTETTSMLLEVANFDAQSIRKTSARHQIRTEASNRFEKAIDTQRCDQALGLAQHLLTHLQPEAKITAYGSSKISATESLTIDVPLSFLRVRSGRELKVSDVQNALTPLGFKVTVKAPEAADGSAAPCADAFSADARLTAVSETDETGKAPRDAILSVFVPTWRATGDVSLRDDILEEVCRMIGYSHFTYAAPTIELGQAVRQPRIDSTRAMKECLAFRAGLQEIFTYPWVGDAYLKAAGWEPGELLSLATPPAPDRARLRPSLIPGLLEAVSGNLRYYNTFGLFCTEKVFLKRNADAATSCAPGAEQLPEQQNHLGIALAGGDAVLLFRKLKGILTELPRFSGTEPFVLKEGTEKPSWADRNAWMEIQDKDGRVLGTMGLLSPKTAALSGIKLAFAALAELNIDGLTLLPSRDNRFVPLPLYPLVEQDLSILIDQQITWGKIEQAVAKSVKKLEFIEEYRGAQIPEGKKSLMFRFWLASEEGTMTPDQIEKARMRVIKKLTHTLGAEVR